MTMHKVALVLACLSCAGQAIKTSKLPTEHRSDDSLNAFAMLLAALNPGEAFNPSSRGLPSHGSSHRAVMGSRNPAPVAQAMQPAPEDGQPDLAALEAAGEDRSSLRQGAFKAVAGDPRQADPAVYKANDWKFGVPDFDSEACYVLPNDPFPGKCPPMIGGWVELVEMEHDWRIKTGIKLEDDGSVTVGYSTGPPPIESCGMWQCGNKGFQMVIKRTFNDNLDLERNPLDDYSITRQFSGYTMKESETGFEMVMGKIGFFDTDTEIGYFKLNKMYKDDDYYLKENPQAEE